MGYWEEQAAELRKPVYRAIREDLHRIAAVTSVTGASPNNSYGPRYSFAFAATKSG